MPLGRQHLGWAGRAHPQLASRPWPFPKEEAWPFSETSRQSGSPRGRLRRGLRSPRKHSKGRDRKGWRQASEQHWCQPQEISPRPPGFWEESSRPLRGGGESGQVCTVIVKMPPGKAGQRATARLSLTSGPPLSVLKGKAKWAPASLPRCQGGALSVLTLRKAKCVPSRPHASTY